MVYPESIDAVGIFSTAHWKDPKRFTYTPQAFRDYDVDIKIIACAICGSDIHTITGHWGEPYYPLAVGHEIVGHIVKVGPKAKKGLKVGDRVGVGAQCDSCGSCARCCKHFENGCPKLVNTYMSHYPSGVATQGGDASHIRVNSKFVFQIPDSLETKHAAPLFCGGITGSAPLYQNNVGPGSKVGICGIGGIGHMSIMFAKALGAEVYAISRSRRKEEDARKMGADHFIATNEEGWDKNYEDTLDLIINTSSSFTGIDFDRTLNLLSGKGKSVFITAPPASEKLTITPMQMLLNGYSVGGSGLGSPNDIEHMLKVAAENNIKPWIETYDINEENLSKAWQRVESGKVRYRITMVGHDEFFKSK
ncbi:putative NADP-dependent alcohol dehydrogenase [Dipodascopsis uninucleata]